MTERLYYQDSLLRQFRGRVVEIRELAREQGESIWQVALDRSAFYPESGGQPCDLGVLRAVSRSGAVLDVAVEDVQEDEAGTVWHSVRKPLLEGTEVEGLLDGDRRIDHIQQHSGQHLLSAVFFRELGAPTLSFHLGDAVSTVDLDLPELSAADQERIERRANELIAENRPVRLRTVSGEEAKRLLAEGELRKLPPREGAIRLIEMEDIDLNACGGTHVSATGQIGCVLLRGTERVSRGIRVSFVCGLRAVRAARVDFATVGRAAAQLSAQPAQLPVTIERLITESKLQAKAIQKQRDELATYHAARLAVEEPIEHGIRLVKRSFGDRDADYVKLLAMRVTAAVPQTVALFAATGGETARIYLVRSKDLDVNCGTLLKATVAASGGRGGGSPDAAQGECPSAALAALLQELEQEIRARAVV